jgi:hypothetical protein
MHDLVQKITEPSIKNTVSPTNNTCVSTSSITIIPASKHINEYFLYNKIKSIFDYILDIPSVTSTENSINKQDKKKASTCHYTQPSTNVFQCHNQGTYRCSHCGILFCLQHGLKHQDDLKEEVRTLFTKTQVKFI